MPLSVRIFLDLERVLRQGGLQEGRGGFHAFVVVQFQVDVAGGAVDGDEQVKFVLVEVDLRGVDMPPQGGSMDRSPARRF